MSKKSIRNKIRRGQTMPIPVKPFDPSRGLAILASEVGHEVGINLEGHPFINGEDPEDEIIERLDHERDAKICA